MKQKRKNIATAVLLCLVLLTVIFIFSNSMESIPESRARSEGLLKWLEPLFEIFVGEGNVTNHLVRKAAHFAEFFLLGAELTLLSLLNRKPVLWALFAGLLTALADETIQIFYARGAQVQDVWLDFSGVLTAAAGVLLINWLYARKDQR